MSRDAHEQEHDDFHDDYLADTLVILDDKEVIVTPVCPDCKHAECQCFFEPPDEWKRRRRTDIGLARHDR